MKESGIVKEIKDGVATIEVAAAAPCVGCKRCGAAFPREFSVESSSLGDVKTGDEVEIEIPSSSLLKIYALLYGLPLFLFVAVTLSVYLATSNPLLSFIPAFVLAIASSCLSLRMIGCNKRFREIAKVYRRFR